MLSPTGIFFAYYALVFPIPLLVSYYLWIPTAIFDSPRNISQDKLFFAFCQVVVGLASFGVARYTLPIITISWSKRSINRSRLVPLTVVSSIMAAGGGLWVMQRIGGISALTNNLGAVRNGLLRGLGVGTFALTVLPPTVAQFWLMHAYRTKSKYLALILSLCILSTLLGGIFGFRGTIVTLLIQVACVCYLMTGKTYKAQMAILLPILCVGLTILGYLRIVLLEKGNTTEALLQGDSAVLLSTVSDTALTRTRGVELLIVMNDYMAHAGYHLFLDNASETVHTFIPSVIIPKSVSLAEKIAIAVYSPFMMAAGNYSDNYGGVSYTLIAEGEWNLGMAGIVLVCAMAGYALRTIERRDPSVPVSYMQVIWFKTMAGSMVAFIEAPQLGVNGAIITLILNVGILVFLSESIRVI